ncbi:MAG: hypothetical protein WBN55_12155 [Eudoraea sp.]|uniref:hypothetical protein n=1 Tax=Eudoraea sp. TaxID=1979955 RepID=UPI003C78367E
MDFLFLKRWVNRHSSIENNKARQEKDLNNNTLLSLYEDAEHNLWLAPDNVISVINMDFPYKTIILQNCKSTLMAEYIPMFDSRPGLFLKQSRNEFKKE